MSKPDQVFTTEQVYSDAIVLVATYWEADDEMAEYRGYEAGQTHCQFREWLRGFLLEAFEDVPGPDIAEVMDLALNEADPRFADC